MATVIHQITLQLHYANITFFVWEAYSVFGRSCAELVICGASASNRTAPWGSIPSFIHTYTTTVRKEQLNNKQRRFIGIIRTPFSA